MNRVGHARIVLDEIIAACGVHGFRQQRLTEIKLAIEEALANAIFHGNVLMRDGQRVQLDRTTYKRDIADPSKKLYIAFEIQEKMCRVEIENEFLVPWDPTKTRDSTLEGNNDEYEDGRGIRLMRRFSDGVEWNKDAQGNYLGNRVALFFLCGGAVAQHQNVDAGLNAESENFRWLMDQVAAQPLAVPQS